MNTLLCTDVYKIGHGSQYPEDVTEVYSYMEARKPGRVVFFGLQYFLMEYLSKPITKDNVNEFLHYFEKILGKPGQKEIDRFHKLADLGYWPIRIKAVPEGTVIDNKNALLTMVNTHPDFAWCVGFLESFILKLWNSCTVATCSMQYRQLVSVFAENTCDDFSHLPFAVHDFGYRGVSSEESAAISGAAHLLSFYGSDTVPAVAFLDKYYKPHPDTPIGLSVPASEHSVMCSFTRENEYDAFDHMLNLHPTGIVSIVSDTYDLWKVLTEYVESRKERILARDGKVVFRPDSGNPVHIVCGCPTPVLPGMLEWDPNQPEVRGALQLLWDTFGGTVNSKGFKVLNPKVGLIYGDGMSLDRFRTMLDTMANNGWASSNLVIGVGGLLVQQRNRDEHGFAIKATRVIRNGAPVEIYKDPVTDPGKKSKKGLMRVEVLDGIYRTYDQQGNDDGGVLSTVFLDGKILKEYSLEDVRLNLEATRAW